MIQHSITLIKVYLILRNREMGGKRHSADILVFKVYPSQEREFLFKHFLLLKCGQDTIESMRILSRSTLRDFWESHPDIEEALKTWYHEASRADWQSPVDIKAIHCNASVIANNRIVFNIKGNTYRLIVAIRYDVGVIFIRFIGTHAEYDKIDAETI